MANIPIHNETPYPLTDAMTQYILRDAQEYFGEKVQAIRVQTGLERHALNARTHEVRYAFSPQDFGFGHTIPIAPEPLIPEPPRTRQRSSRSDAEFGADLIPASLEDVEDAEDTEPLETSLASLGEGYDDDEEEDDEDDNVFDPDELGA